MISRVLLTVAFLIAPVFAADKAELAAKPFLIVIDPAHGGSDLGSRFSATSDEKSITLAFARRLRTELQAQNISVRLLRDSDVQLSTDQRAAAANAAQPAIFITIHAGLPGDNVRVFTSLLKAQSSTSKPRLFLPWDNAQAISLHRSREIASTLVDALHKNGIAASLQTAALLPLNSVVAPAVALELATNRTRENKATRNSEDSQKSLAKAIASVIAAQRPPGEPLH